MEMKNNEIKIVSNKYMDYDISFEFHFDQLIYSI